VWDQKETFELVAVRTEARRLDFDDWVLRRLSDWPSARIHQFETFLLDRGEIEFVRAVRAALRDRESAA
jgi:hypothetical protein